MRSTASRFKQNLNTFSDSVRSKVRGIFRPRRDANGWIAPARTVDGLNEAAARAACARAAVPADECAVIRLN